MTIATCGHGMAHRRGLCRTCYVKLGGAGLPCGPDGRVDANAARGLRQLVARLAGTPQERLDALAAKLPADARARLAKALERGRS